MHQSRNDRFWLVSALQDVPIGVTGSDICRVPCFAAVMCSQLLQASREQGLRKSHGQSSNCSFDSLESLISNSSGSSTPRSQLRARLLKSALVGSLQSCPGQGSPSKTKSKLRHASSSPEIAKQVQFFHEQQQQQQSNGRESSNASPAGSDGGSPRRLAHCSTACELGGSKKGSKGDAGSLSGLLSSLFGARKQQQSRAGTQAAGKQVQEQGAQTGSSLSGARVTKEETSHSQVEEAGQRALCVGRQKERAAAEDMSAELAQLAGRPQSVTQPPRPHDFFLLAPEAAAGISTAAAELNGECAVCCS
jgi:hypothetical protein